jgi:hypothetical protein
MSCEDKMTDCLTRIRAEYCDLPGLRLTKAQFRRLWSLDETTCEAVLEALEASSFLRRTQTGAYVKVRPHPTESRAP